MRAAAAAEHWWAKLHLRAARVLAGGSLLSPFLGCAFPLICRRLKLPLAQAGVTQVSRQPDAQQPACPVPPAQPAPSAPLQAVHLPTKLFSLHRRPPSTKTGSSKSSSISKACPVRSLHWVGWGAPKNAGSPLGDVGPHLPCLPPPLPAAPAAPSGSSGAPCRWAGSGRARCGPTRGTAAGAAAEGRRHE